MLKINMGWSLLWSLPLSLLMNLGATAFATTIKLNVLPLNGVERGCPERLIAYETLQPYREGGYTINGTINLSEIATNITNYVIAQLG